MGKRLDFLKMKYWKNYQISLENKKIFKIYNALNELGFPISEIKSFYYFDIGRWDIILNNKKVIKLPVRKFF